MAPHVHGPPVAPAIQGPPGLSTAPIAPTQTAMPVPATAQMPSQNHEESRGHPMLDGEISWTRVEERLHSKAI